MRKIDEVKLCLDHRKEIGGTKSNLTLKEDVIGLKARAEVTDEETVKAAEEKRLEDGLSVFGSLGKNVRKKTE